MANPQCENGYTAIANEIMEALARTRIPGVPRQIFDFILRKTYGFKKTKDSISLSQFVLGTGLSKVAICKGREVLIQMNLITKNGNEDVAIYSINKNFDSWNVLPKRVIVTNNGNKHYQKRKSSLPNMVPTKETITKETITKEKRLCAFRDFYAKYPKKKAKADAQKAWMKIVDSEELIQKIMASLEDQIEKKILDVDRYQYIPLPATWLRGERWEDEIESKENKPQWKSDFDKTNWG